MFLVGLIRSVGCKVCAKQAYRAHTRIEESTQQILSLLIPTLIGVACGNVTEGGKLAFLADADALSVTTG